MTEIKQEIPVCMSKIIDFNLEMMNNNKSIRYFYIVKGNKYSVYQKDITKKAKKWLFKNVDETNLLEILNNLEKSR